MHSPEQFVVHGATQPQTSYGTHAHPCPAPKAPTVSIRTGLWSNGRRLPGLINHVFFFMSLASTTYLNQTTWTLSWNGCDLFQQDNVPCHKAKVIQEWFEVHNNTFEVLTCPPNFQDLSLIEHLKGYAGQTSLRPMETQPHNLQD